MKKKGFNSNTNGNENENNGVSEIPKQKERHIVSWSQEEDDILREQIQIHGTENWTIIASKFEDKTTRQCRRRWYTYLNSDFKKGGWSPEEDQLLCEAQKIFGNRWTEIAKVVSGRTDNAVKNRFSTLCKKRAKHEALAKENNNSFININNKRIIFTMEGVSNKKMRIETGEKSIVGYGNINELVRSPFTVLAQNFKQIEDAASEDSSEYSSGSATTDKEKGLGGVADVEYNSPIQVTPIFTSLAEAVPTPNFSESERHFLLKTLGLESASTAPPCKRVLLNSL